MPRAAKPQKVELTTSFLKSLKKMCIQHDVKMCDVLECLEFTPTNFYIKVRSGTLTFAEVMRILQYIGATEDERREVINLK